MKLICVQGIQGSGKTTLVRNICNHRSEYDYISLDDFYKPHDDLKKDFEKLKDERFRYRGNPGTHDISLLYEVLIRLKENKDSYVPVYDKNAHHGQGDRDDIQRFISGKKKAVFVEGWCLGFKYCENTKNDLVNDFLRDYVHKLYNLFDGSIVLRVETYAWAYQWRKEAECENSQLDMKDFFRRVYEPTYQKYLETFYDCPTILPCLQITIDKNREYKSHKRVL